LPVGETPNPSAGGLGPDGTGKVEIFTATKYLTMTGLRLETSPADIPDRHAASVAVFRQFFPATTPRANTAASSTENPNENPTENPTENPNENPDDPWQRGPRSDDALILLMRAAANGPKFEALYDDGDWRGTGYPSQSEADAGLLEMILFYNGGDEAQADRLFRTSGLMRKDKWNREDYRRMTFDFLRRKRAEAIEEATAAATAMEEAKAAEVPNVARAQAPTVRVAPSPRIHLRVHGGGAAPDRCTTRVP
jgi:primase-polymerase (primpol)-like protein